MKKLLLPIVILFMGISVAFAQKTVSGNVVDDQGIPLPGATILEQGTTNGVSSDFDGNFSIEVAEGAVLVISFVGYQTQEITVGAEDNISVALEAGNELEEVVVTSLGITFSFFPSISRSITVDRKFSDLKTSCINFSSTLIFKFGLLPPYNTPGMKHLDLRIFN